MGEGDADGGHDGGALRRKDCAEGQRCDREMRTMRLQRSFASWARSIGFTAMCYIVVSTYQKMITTKVLDVRMRDYALDASARCSTGKLSRQEMDAVEYRFCG